ncbi:MAG: glutamine-hydrolyzing GMP synthase [bacterium]
MKRHPEEYILILDFGSQYTQLITRKVRELGVYSEIKPFNYSLQEIKKHQPKGIILSGGPASVYDRDAPVPEEGLFELSIPILGICYGLQLVSHFYGGQVAKAERREYGLAELKIENHEKLFRDLGATTRVWMSHGDSLTELPSGFEVLACTDSSHYAAVVQPARQLYCVQFHPEVAHTVQGKQILKNFLFEICKCRGNWSSESFIHTAVAELKETIGSSKAICGLSGGVDSAVAAALVFKAVGNKLQCIFVDTGLLRKNEALQVEDTFTEYFNSNILIVDAAERFLSRLHNVTDPEEKRKIIGNTFIEIFEQESEKLSDVEYLVQGTLYPDVIESASVKGPAVTIKTHHNVGGLPEKMNLKLVEPLRDLFKDEVRTVGKALGLPEDMLNRHPFPGPGLAVRILGEVTLERIQLLQEVDWIYIEELKNNHWYDKIWQAFAVLLPVKTVGVMGDQRTYDNVIGLRAVTSVDGMTADWARIPAELLATISNRIINEVRGVNRVVYDISSKPPSTIEWE